MRQDAWVISDLHIGEGDGDPLDDFKGDDVLAEFIRSIGGEHHTLVINGDFIDFLKIAAYDLVNVSDLSGLPDIYLWDETTSVAKLAKAAAGHAVVFGALTDFVAGGGALRFTIGNHDLDLGWAAVQSELRALVGDRDNRVAFDLEHTLFERVHIEHGHRFTGENCPRDFRNYISIWEPAGRPPVKVLECVWGSRFVLDELNPIERTHPFVGNVKPTWKVAYHMLVRGDWLTGRRATTLLKLVRFLRRAGVPWRDIAAATLDADDLTVDGVTLEQAFTDAEWRALVREIRITDRDELIAAIAALPPEDKAAAAAPVAIEFGGDVSLAPSAATLGLLRDSREERAAKECLGHDGITHVVFGHTHAIVDGTNSTYHETWLNPGSWIPHLDTANPVVKAKGGLTKELVSDERLYRTERRTVHLVFDGSQVDASLEPVPAS
jgi:UDP-2,3-diacylglucosamine pyrophosphatase LpxH